MLCILEAKVNPSSHLDPWFHKTHQIFPLENCCNNFSLSSPGRIWLKWNPSSLTFNTVCFTSQLIHGSLRYGNSPPFYITFVYAANSPHDRAPLWHQLLYLANSISSPWIVMGDFNCFRDPKDKAGGAPIHFSRMGEFNAWVFNSGTFDLKSTGLRYTWFNGRVDDPIHIKLDRMLVNQKWLDSFPLSYYKVVPPTCSDHTPLLLCSGAPSLLSRFQFKNYWLNFDGFWDILITSFATHHAGSLISNLYGKLKTLKLQLKSKNWAKNDYVKSHLEVLLQQQKLCLDHLQTNPLDQALNASLKALNNSILNLQKAWSSWIIQRAKEKWLYNGEDDLGFLYARIKTRANSSKIREIFTDEGHFNSPPEVAKAIVDHFKKLYNPLDHVHSHNNLFACGDSIPNHLIAPLIAPISDTEIKQVVFAGPSSSAPGPDGFTFEFYKGAWEVISKAGLRQGCPLSPLLFAITMDAFSTSLDASSFSGIPCADTSINHLLYADDVLVFGLASINNAMVLSNFLKVFALASGLYINHSKCSILFSDNTPLANDISFVLGFSPTEHSLKYLGLPISIKKLSSAHFQPLLSRISTLLDGWKVKFLSFAGRIQFLRFTIANTLAYWIRGSIIPKSCMKFIDKLCSRFLYHGNTEGKKLHLIAWHKTCLPTSLGGLGIPNFHALAHGFGCSFIWRWYTTKSLVFDWFKFKYLSPWKPIPLKCPSFWKYIHSVASRIKNDLRFNVLSEGCNFSLFWDPWMDGKMLSDFFTASAGLSDKLCSLIQHGTWCLPNYLPLWVKQLISAIPISASVVPLHWKNLDKPSFKVFKMNFFDGCQLQAWHKFIWHKRAVLRHSSYAWLLIRDGLKTADILAKRNIFINPICPLCHGGVESGAHLYFSCEFSFAIITYLLPVLNCFLLRPTVLQLFEFVEEISTLNPVEKNFCYFVICCVIYFIWRERNDRRFEGSHLSQHELCKKIAWIISCKTSKWKDFELLQALFPSCFLAGGASSIYWGQ
ncbi:Putative ribonuclease H protein [Dendrobium catenatum]|uniref:Ribonuclease H protein n=1 Tax=Dendrobium catenatum TaxID=906689 RepID=A0A2I0VCX6_9ASPA|nr:Putative ribonuclease H protein [Dendrobium catenatum]